MVDTVVIKEEVAVMFVVMKDALMIRVMVLGLENAYQPVKG